MKMSVFKRLSIQGDHDHASVLFPSERSIFVIGTVSVTDPDPASRGNMDLDPSNKFVICSHQ